MRGTDRGFSRQDALTFEQFVDEYYICDGDKLYGKIIDCGRDNFLVRWEDSDVPVPEHTLESAKLYVKKHFKEHEPI